MRKSLLAALISGGLLSFSAIAQEVGVELETEAGLEAGDTQAAVGADLETDAGLEAGDTQVDVGADLDLDVTLEVIDTPEGIGDMMGRIELPPSASDQGRASSAQGLERANAAREGGEAFGQSGAEQARENRGRPDGVGRPDSAERPDSVERPDDVGGAPEGIGRPDGVGAPERIGRP